MAVNEETFNNLNARIQSAALQATRHAVSLPSDISFHRSIHPEFAEDIDDFSARVLSLTNTLLSFASSSQSDKGKTQATLTDTEDVVDNFHALIVDSLDHLLEKTDICLDQFLGKIKGPAIAVNPVALSNRQKQSTAKGRLDPSLQHSAHLRKPQLSFATKVNNFDESTWRPVLSHKFNAQVPLGYNYQDDSNTGMPSTISHHPYHYEITHTPYPNHIFTPTEPTPPASFTDTPFIFVSTPAQFHEMLPKLRTAKELAIDLEHHSYRSFSGFLCLMQISTREADWVVDILVPEVRALMGELAEVFTDPGIVKVFHGADSDIVWLQQDFSLYIVNLFDTFHASKVLDFPRHGLANLLEMYCDFVPDKRYQLADWRIRPLPQEMLEYARSDTHFLLFIYDNLRNALLDRATSLTPSSLLLISTNPTLDVSSPRVLVTLVLSRSEEVALRTYEREVYDAENGTGPGGWENLAKKWNRGFLAAGDKDMLQTAVYKAVHAWRDRVAREEDESTRYVLSNQYVFSLAEKPPKDLPALLSIFHGVPPAIRKRATELLDTIRAVLKDFEKTGAPAAPAIVKEQPAAIVEVEMQVDSQSTPTSDVDDISAKLWSNAAGTSAVASNAVASSSSLFGSHQKPAAVETVPTTSYVASKSSLLGQSKRQVAVVNTAQKTQFKDLVARIHSALVIAPSAPTEIVTEKAETLTEEEEDDTIMQGMQVEIPYVPASQRHTSATEPINDSIIVVGQARQKKRKRVKTVDSGSGSKSTELEVEGPEPEFDFADVPNILDDQPVEEKQKRKRQKKVNKSGVFEYGNFPAPPKAHSELRSGNQSHTFK